MNQILRYCQSCVALAWVLSIACYSPYASAKSTVGELELENELGTQHTALLLDTAISGNVNGMLASITVTQTFKNDSDSWLNGRYVFPFTDGAAVDSLNITIGDRIINGVIKEKEDAQRVFKKAKRDGKKAGLLQQHRANVFSIALANIGPHETIIATITFIDKVRYNDDIFSLTLPTTLTPRYIPNASPTLTKKQQQQLESDLRSDTNVEVNTTHGWAANNARVDDASDITPPQTHSIIPETSHRFSLDLSLKSGLDLQRIASSTHTIKSYFSQNPKAHGVHVTLANGHELMDSDLILEWQPILGSAPKAALFQQPLEGSFYSMLMLTPPQTSASVSLPRDITFIVDSSGSMAGEPMRQAKQALHDGLKYLNAGDRFNIVDFDSHYRTLYSQSQPATADHLRNAKRMINGLQAGGGTEMNGALHFALNTHKNSSYLSQIIFITDGAIGNESELFKLIKKDLGNSRLFTVGIGSAPNAFFMSKTAKFGRGTYTYINDMNQVNQKIAQLFEKITKPVLRDLDIKWPTDVEQYPARLPDLYAGEPLTVFVKSSTPIDKVVLHGSMLNTPWAKTISQPKSMGQEHNIEHSQNLDTVWARQKIAQIMDQYHTGEKTLEQVKPVVTKLGIGHHILTKFTAFIAVEKTPSKPNLEQAKHKSVANLMPRGSAMPIPQTATASLLMGMLGVLLMLISLLARKRINRRTSSPLTTTSEARSQRMTEA